MRAVAICRAYKGTWGGNYPPEMGLGIRKRFTETRVGRFLGQPWGDSRTMFNVHRLIMR